MKYISSLLNKLNLLRKKESASPSLFDNSMHILKKNEGKRTRSAAKALIPLLGFGLKSVRNAEARWSRSVLFMRDDIYDLQPAPNIEDHGKVVREEAITMLRKIGKTAYRPLIRALKNPSADIRRAAVVLLGELRDPRALPALVCAEKDSKIDSAVLGALQNIGVPAIPALLRMFRARNYFAGRVLAEIGPPAFPRLIDVLKDGDMRLKLNAARALKEVGWVAQNDDELFLYERGLNEWDAIYPTNWPLNSESEKCLYYFILKRWDDLAKMGAASITILQEGLRSKDYSLFEVSLQTIVEVGEAALPALMAYFKDPKNHRYPDNKDHCRVIAAMGEIGGEKAAVMLIDIIMQNFSSWPSQFASAALRRIGQAALPSIVQALHQCGDHQKIPLINTVAEMNDIRAIPALETVTYKNSYVRATAERAI